MKPIKIGESIGRVVILEKISAKGSQLTKYLCRCVCGKETDKFGSSLSKARKSGNDIACKACSYDGRNQILKKHEAVVCPGAQFGFWLVVGLTDKRTIDRKALYECVCKCGKRKDLTSYILRSGRSTGCVQCVNELLIQRCGICGCKNHLNLDLEGTHECDHLGVCQICDRFEVRDHFDVSRFKHVKALIGCKSKAKSERRFQIRGNS